MPRFQVQRSISIQASAEQVFDVVADYGNWTVWSPWLCAEPEAEVRVSDDPSSVGSLYAWNGELVGAGEIEHQVLERGALIEDEIRFLKPFCSTSRVTFEMEPEADGSRLTWRMQGTLPWFLFWMRSQMETFVGMDYERGLKMLKEFIETGSVLSETTVQGIQKVGPVRMAGVRKRCSLADIGPVMTAALDEAREEFCRLDVTPEAGGAVTVYLNWNLRSQVFEFLSGFLLPESAPESLGSLSCWSTPEISALRVDHRGSYEHVGNAWSAAWQVARYRKHKVRNRGTFEFYRDNPEETDVADLRTEVYLPLK